jgi:hypothetical protein
MVSFFFTPIYMFILNFIVLFNVKKGSIIAYRSAWSSLLSNQVYLIFYRLKNSMSSASNNIKLFNYSYHFTVVTSRSTSYFLFSFWIFFFFFGEFLLLLVFNFTTPIDTITSDSFFLIKQHIIFLTETMSSKLGSSLSFYIYFLTSCSVLYLINLSYASNYNFYKLGMTGAIIPTFIFLF